MMKPDPRQHIYERDNFTCIYCGAGGRDNFEDWFMANLGIDHIKPRKHGGTDEDSNLVVACHACNIYKGCTDCNTLEEAKEVVQEKRKQAKKWFDHFVKQS